MNITLSPYAPLPDSDDALNVSKVGDVLTINDTPYDFSVIPDGATLPEGSTDCPYIIGAIERVGGELHLTLRLPVMPDASEAACFPLPIVDPADGLLELPK